MKLEQLLEIKAETDRFQRKLKDAIILAKATPGYISSYDGALMCKNEISGTRTSAALKRAALDLKHELTQKL